MRPPGKYFFLTIKTKEAEGGVFQQAPAEFDENRPHQNGSFWEWFRGLTEMEKNGFINIYNSAGIGQVGNALPTSASAHGARLTSNLKHLSDLRISRKWPDTYSVEKLLDSVGRLDEWVKLPGNAGK